MKGSAKDGPTSALARIRNTVLTRGGAASILQTLAYVAQCGTAASYARAVTRRLRSRAAHGWQNSTEIDSDSLVCSTILGSTDRSTAIGGVDRWMSRVSLTRIGRKILRDMGGVAGEGRRTASASDALIVCAKFGGLGGISILNGGRCAKALGCDRCVGKASNWCQYARALASQKRPEQAPIPPRNRRQTTVVHTLSEHK
jgi:hypothetical protein